MGRRALIVGINHYDNFGPESQLFGPTNDARRVAEVLDSHDNGDPNYHCRVLTSDTQPVTLEALRDHYNDLFRGVEDEVIFYFSGHGGVTQEGGYLVTQDGDDDLLGLSMDELLAIANASDEREVIIILDCCQSGMIGNLSPPREGGPYQQSLLRQNVTILAASMHNQSSFEVGGEGIFTSLFVDALKGGAADIVGSVTLPAVYAHVEGSLGGWDQRPIYKSHITTVKTLRRTQPKIEPRDLRRLPEFFMEAHSQYQLTPDHEYDKIAESEKQKIGELFKCYRDVGLLVPVEPGAQLYWVAMENGYVRLTPLGRHYWNLAKKRMI